jgi:Short C-terminal domain
MPKRIENLERLARLRADGLLTDAEFEAEKARLLAEPSDEGEYTAANGDDTALDAPDTGLSKFGRWAWLIAIAFLVGTVALGWDRFGFGGDSELAGGEALADPLTAASSQWVVSENTDPMTDAVVTSAQRRFEMERFSVEAVLTCTPSGEINYAMTSFNRDGTPADNLVQYFNGPSHGAEFRIDDRRPVKLGYQNMRYSNFFEIVLSRAFMGDKLFVPNRVVIRLFLKQGDAIIDIDQTDSTLNAMLSNCIGEKQAHAEDALFSWTLKEENGSSFALYGQPQTSATYSLECLPSEKAVEFTAFEVERPSNLEIKLAAAQEQSHRITGRYEEDDVYPYFAFQAPMDLPIWNDLAAGNLDLKVTSDGALIIKAPTSPVLTKFITGCLAKL